MTTSDERLSQAQARIAQLEGRVQALQRECLHAILAPPQLDEFHDLCGLADAPLEVTFNEVGSGNVLRAGRRSS